MTHKKSGDKPEPVTASAAPARLKASFGYGTFWLTTSWAKEWFEDALHEAETGTDHNAIRREIVFAVSFAESYLFEWTRDQILDKGDFQKLVIDLDRYFPPEKPRSVLNKWRDVPKRLLKDGRIPATPNLNRSYWK